MSKEHILIKYIWFYKCFSSSSSSSLKYMVWTNHKCNLGKPNTFGCSIFEFFLVLFLVGQKYIFSIYISRNQIDHNNPKLLLFKRYNT